MATEETNDLKVTELENGALEVSDPKAVIGEDEDDAPLKSSEGGAESSEEEQGHAAETEDEAEARRERNRQRRMQNKENRKNYVESLKRELAARDSLISDLSSRVASVEQHSIGNQVAQLDAAINEAAGYYNHFKTLNRKAIELADGATAVDAQEKMFAAQNRHQMLLNAKKNMTSQVSQPKPLDPRMVNNAQSWIERNPWYDASGSDADSDLVMKIDSRLVQEGMNPTTSEYWEELDARVKKYLPHRANSGYNSAQGKQNSRQHVPVSGSSQESGSGKKGSYVLSAERVKALKEAGIYDDPIKRADAIRRFQQYDKENA